MKEPMIRWRDAEIELSCALCGRVTGLDTHCLSGHSHPICSRCVPVLTVPYDPERQPAWGLRCVNEATEADRVTAALLVEA